MEFVHVAVAVVFNQSGKVLISRRHAEAHQGGRWEFPGGKVEANETVFAALRRELFEEVNIIPIEAEPLIKIKHHYADKSVMLDVWRVDAYESQAYGKEQQDIAWCLPAELNAEEFPLANKSIITALCLPELCLITPNYLHYPQDYFDRLRSALASGIRLLQLRDTAMTSDGYFDLATQVSKLCEQYKAKLILNSDADLLVRVSAQGLHLNSQRLFQYQSRPVASSVLLSAACHNECELEQANLIDVDFIFISPVRITATHADGKALGWERFAELVTLSNKPVYALGGMRLSDLQVAQSCGAIGVAGIRNFFGALNTANR